MSRIPAGAVPSGVYEVALAAQAAAVAYATIGGWTGRSSTLVIEVRPVAAP